MTEKKSRPNILLVAIDSLRSDHMSCYGYHRLTTPHIDRFAKQGVLFEQTYSAHVPTTPAYSSMLTGRDCFGTQVVALSHQGGLRQDIRTLPEMLKEEGYATRCVGFSGNPASRGFDEYLTYEQWGKWAERPSRKAELLNDVTLPEIEKLNAAEEPWFMMLRHMDPHSPYLPPSPCNKLFYAGDPTDPALPDTARRMREFKPFADYFATWMPAGLRDINWVDAQYDGAVAYMDACIGAIFQKLEELGILENTIVVINGDHGEILQEHECWFDHHGMYDPNLHVPLIIRYPSVLPSGLRVAGYNQHKNLVPTLLELAGIQVADEFDGKSLTQLVRGETLTFESEFYITECTWMHKHGWRTPQWKFIEAIEPDFHFMPAVELYHLAEDPRELNNVADLEPEIVQMMRTRMQRFIEKRKNETGLPNPSFTQKNWSSRSEVPFSTSQAAYDVQHISDPTQAKKIQAGSKNDGIDFGGLMTRPERVITVIGRGHSGTRAIAGTLSASGVFMGSPLNESSDLVPAEAMYDACRIIGRHVTYLGDAKWDFSKLHTMPIDAEFQHLLRKFLSSVVESGAEWRGWKIPETVLCYPWIVRLFPDIHYIHWWRDPRDCILAAHNTDDLTRFGVPCPATDDLLEQRALSWLYQDQMMRDAPVPARVTKLQFEEFVLDQSTTLKKLSEAFGFPVTQIPVRPDAVGRWKHDTRYREIKLLQPALKRLGYL